MLAKLKQGMKKRYHSFSWEFADWLDWRPQLRGNSKKKQKHVFAKAERRAEKQVIQEEINLL